jgi:HD-GYP domain-containing protein (c-di-GMP phosphodiesterase class II)
MLPQRRAPTRIPLISVISGLSHALDLTEGHPYGHANRSCIIGMRIAQELGLPAEQQANLHHALLLKDAGCSSNAQRVHELFGGDDHEVKRAVWLRDWRSFAEQVSYALQYTERSGTLLARLRKLVLLATKGPRGGGELFRIRCDRGAQIALAMGFPRQTAEAIRSMDEHWDGGGYPDGLRKDAIPIESRIINLAQVAEIFFEAGGPALALETVAKRSRRWFDPELVRVFTKIATPPGFWYALRAENLIATVTALQPSPSSVAADPQTLERIALAFAWVIDAKSPYTYEHSEGVSSIASRIGGRLGFNVEQLARLRQMALLHDIGKLAVPNRILDKRGPLTDQEFDIVREHPRHTYEILSGVPIFSELADEAGSHHERMDGRGYHRGIPAGTLSAAARVLTVADVTEALGSDRPYRKGMSPDAVAQVLRDTSGTALCPRAVEAALDVLNVPTPGPPSTRSLFSLA